MLILLQCISKFQQKLIVIKVKLSIRLEIRILSYNN